MQKRYRETRYPAQMVIGMTDEQRAEIIAAAEAAEMSAAAMARDAIRRGLPLVKDAIRKARQRERQPARTGSAK